MSSNNIKCNTTLKAKRSVVDILLKISLNFDTFWNEDVSFWYFVAFDSFRKILTVPLYKGNQK
jgi:hypothetical protein